MAIDKKLLRIIAVVLSTIIVFSTILSVTVLSNAETTDGTDKETPATVDIHTDNILDKASLELSEDDEVIRTDNNGVISLTILRAFTVPVDYNGKIIPVKIATGTVADVLEKAGITLKENEKVSPEMDAQITEDTKIVISDTVGVDVTLMGETKTYEVPNGTVAQALLSIGAEIDKNDKLNVSEDEKVYEGMEITLVKVSVKKETETKAVNYKEKVEKTDSMYKGESEITQYGQNGAKEVTSKNTYEDGVLVNSEVLSEEVTKKPVSQITKVGTKEKVQNHPSKPFSYSKVITGSATAYTAPKGSSTATGATACVGCVAVNPNIIPYGSKLYIEASDGSYVYGYATAVDTGGALMDGSAIVDLFMDSYADCAKFGRRDVNIYVLS